MNDRFVRRKIEDEEFLLDLEAGRFYGINDSAAAILAAWKEGVREPDALADRLVAAFEVPRAEALAAVEKFLPVAKERGLLEGAP